VQLDLVESRAGTGSIKMTRDPTRPGKH